MSVLKERIQRLHLLLQKVTKIPAEWAVASGDCGGGDRIEPLFCKSWATVESEWMKCMRWRQEISDVFSAMMAVAASTSQAGDQLCLQVVADAGSGKGRMCDALLVSHHCFPLRHFTGFHSGKKGEEGKDLSLIGRINHKTLITPEGDTLVSSPMYHELMSQMRQIYDGSTGSIFKTTDNDMEWKGLRTPWILACTPALLDHDQSRVGDRFLRVRLHRPAGDERRQIVLAAMRSQRSSVIETSNGSGGGVEQRWQRAYALAGGYVNWLRENLADAVRHVDMNGQAEWHLADLAELIADMRARPNPDQRKQEVHDTKELPTRLGSQLVRLAMCLAVVMNKESVDKEVLRRVRKVALDTSYGRTMDLCRWFFAVDTGTRRTYQDGNGLMTALLARWAGYDESKLLAYLNFLAKIEVVEHAATPQSSGYWKLTPRVAELYLNIHARS